MVLELPPAPAARVLLGLWFADFSARSAAAFLRITVAGPPGGLGDAGRAVVEPEAALLTGDVGRGEDCERVCQLVARGEGNARGVSPMDCGSGTSSTDDRAALVRAGAARRVRGRWSQLIVEAPSPHVRLTGDVSRRDGTPAAGGSRAM